MATEHIRHRLGASVRFVDAFTARPVTVPLDVRAETLPVVPGMPAVPWRAVRGPEDDTYRLMVSNETVMPAGAVTVQVTAPGDQYANLEPLVVTLPRPLVAHPPTPARSDYLVTHALWPTRAYRIPPGETAILGRIVSGGVSPIAGLRITCWLDGTPMPATPYAYSNDRGEFVHRLPTVKMVMGGTISPTASLQIDVRLPPLYTTVVVPTLITTDAGAVLGIPMTIAVGRVAQLTISLA
jgi:hypothetical protein